ncbi:hypothetical protein [Sagittula stellata]|nr:hypothetical protein [Sagittula stellata]
MFGKIFFPQGFERVETATFRFPNVQTIFWSRRAVEQTDAGRDGCQASRVYLNCEDGHASIGVMRFMSHKNTNIVAKLENQPYHIVEVSGPVGVPVRDETVTFSGGATATVGHTSPAPSHNIKGQLVL